MFGVRECRQNHRLEQMHLTEAERKKPAFDVVFIAFQRLQQLLQVWFRTSVNHALFSRDSIDRTTYMSHESMRVRCDGSHSG